MNCWMCEASDVEVACDACGAPQPPQVSADHFARLSSPQTFAVDTVRLAAVYRDRVRRVHPDRFSAASERVRAVAQAQMAALNDALRTLTDPLSRLVYLLEVRGVALPRGTEASLGPGFQMELIELQSALHELDGDDARSERNRISREVANRYESLLAGLGGAIDAGATISSLVAGQTLAQLGALRSFLDALYEQDGAP